MNTRHPLIETFDQMLDQELPNLFRLYVNPFVAQTCLCLERYVQGVWPGPGGEVREYQTFLANGFDEALGGAIKLARYDRSIAGAATLGMVIDSAGRLGPFAGAKVQSGATVEFLPGVVVLGPGQNVPAAAESGARFGWVALVPGPDGSVGADEEGLRRWFRSLAPAALPLLITCPTRQSLAALRRGEGGVAAELVPDIVVFDDSFTNHHVPFGAFTARRALYDHWNRPGKTTFHSTTYQPNTVSTLHFMRCLESADPEFHATVASDLGRIRDDSHFRAAQFRRLYSRSLYNATRATGLDTVDIRAAGDFIYARGGKIFDGVSGVACSVRGHNPPDFAREIAELDDAKDPAGDLNARLRELTGLEHALPAVSGATGVENGLKLALVAQFPRRHVLALKSGFGGKTLFALTATWKSVYKEHIGPLYGDVSCVDPFAPDAAEQIEAVLQAHPVAVVHLELIQGVGGVRRVPEAVVRLLDAGRARWGYFLLVDEVQTGMYRTGPFTRSSAMGFAPDLLVVGKGISDMMFPFAMLMYSSAVQAKLDAAGSDLPAAIRQRYGYEYGYKTALNVIRRADELGMPQRVAEAGALFARLLGEGLASCKAVREIRVFGLLIGIELDASRLPQRWVRKRLFQFYVLAMLRHPRYPVLAGFCQYEPNVLKITPSLSVEPAVIREACATIVEVLRRPFHRLAAAAMWNVIKLKAASPTRSPTHDNDRNDTNPARPNLPAREPVAR